MLRTFVEHRVRQVVSLGGLWDFVTEPERKDRAALPKGYTRKIHVPSPWEMVPGLETYRGKGWLRRELPGGVTAGRAARLVFGGVSHTGRVFVDGKFVGEHYDAFTPWAVLAPGSARGGAAKREIIVEVDNSFGEHSALHIENDYMTYGGITRPAVMEIVPAVYVDKLFATPVREGKGWRLDVRVRLRNWSDASQRRAMNVDVAGVMVDLGSVTVQAGKTREVKGSVLLKDVKPWSPESPQLYEITATLYDGDEPVDDLIDRVGFREVRVKGTQILFNGSPIRMRGYNRHEDHPQFGCALPVEAMMTDLNLLRDLGCNFVRTSHYPNDQRFLDLCDELGFYVWEESHSRSTPFDHPKFREQIATSTKEMMEWHHNHASIIMWGCLNECETRTKAGRAEHKRVLDLIKKLDPSRPTTYASHFDKNDLCHDLADIVSLNKYVGWYDAPAEQTQDWLDDMIKWLDTPKGGGKGKPIILSEFGGGAIYGYRHPRETHWTEEYQCHVLEETLKVYLHHPRVCGAAIWQFCDVRLTPTWWSHRPRNMNNKGTVDEYRRPKLSYAVVQRMMREAAKKWDR